MTNFCITCGMPLNDTDLIGTSHELGDVCIYCVDENKKIKPCQEIFNGGIKFFKDTFNEISDDDAKRLLRANMIILPYWQNSDENCLKGDIATQEELNSYYEKIKNKFLT